VVFITLILWCYTFIFLGEHITHLINFDGKGVGPSLTKERLITEIGQKPTDVSCSKDSDGNIITIVTYKYHFPPFKEHYEYTFKNDLLIESRSGAL
jgi:hypothetical protein